MILKNGKRIDGLGDNMPIGSIVEYNGTDIPDGWEILPGDANVYIGVEEPINGQEVWIQRGKNLFDKDATVIGWLNADGSINYETTYRTSTFIKVTPNTTYYKTPSGSARLKFYGKNKNPLSDVYNDIMNADYAQAFTTPVNAYYLRITMTVDYLDTLQIEFGDKPTEYESYIDKKIYIKNEAGSYDLFVKNRVHTGPYQPEDGEEIWIQKSRNLFNINGEVNLSCSSGVILSGANVVSGNVLTATQNTYYTHNVGQQFTNLKGKTFTISAKVLSNGTGKSGYIAVYEDYGRVAGHNIYAGETGSFSWTGKSDNIIIGFATATGENAQFTDIQIELGDERTEYEPYVTKKIYIKDDNGYEQFYNEESENYSYQERKIGTWLNGKPLYQRTYVFTLGDGVRSANIDLNIDNLDTVFIDSGASLVEYGSWSTVQLGFYAADTDFTRGFISGDKTYIGIAMGTAYTSGEKVVTTTIKYTKTTD